MLDRIANWFRFQLELFILRGPLYRLLAVALLIATIAVTAGLLVFAFGAVFASVGEAIWWAFLRLTDPGYLGDDRGAFVRTVSTIVTVLGYVIFLGALVAIMTQWFQQTMNQLQAGYTPIVQKQHILVLGWTNRTATMIHELFHSEGRVKRFLQRYGARRLRVVLLSEADPAVVMRDLRDHLGRLWEPARFILRSGDPLRLEHLERVDFLNASVILLPAAELSSPLDATVDGGVVKTLMTIADAAAELDRPAPFAVAEMMDGRKSPLARRAYDGPLEVIASDEFLSRMVAHTLRKKGLSAVYSDLLGHEVGNAIFLRECHALAGMRFADIFTAFTAAVPIGVSRKSGRASQTILNPPGDLLLRDDDRLVAIAEDYAHLIGQRTSESFPVEQIAEPRAEATGPVRRRRMLILGWNHRSATLMRELDGYIHESFEVDIVSRTDAEEREELMKRLGVQTERVRVGHIEADFTSPSDLAHVDPASYDSILLAASEWSENDTLTDARTILGYLVLSELLAEAPQTPHILVELLNPDNAALFRRKSVEVLISPVLISHLLTQVALRRELCAVFTELFGPKGVEVSFCPAADLLGEGLGDRRWSFDDIQRASLLRGDIALGLRLAGATAVDVVLNPKRSLTWALSDNDEIIVLQST